MAETVKVESRRKKIGIIEGDCVSIPPIFFGCQWSSNVPSHITKITGRVRHVFTNRVTVCWDLNGSEQTVDTQKLSIEVRDTPKQVLEESVQSMSTSTSKQIDFTKVLGLVTKKLLSIDDKNLDRAQ